MKWIRRDIRTNALLAAPAVALALAACGGGASDVSSDAASAPAAVTAEAETSAPVESTELASESTTSEAATSDSGDPAEASTETTAAVPLIQRLSADEAIANAEINLPSLQSADNVLDIETLAVSDGSVQTLRNVVAGDRPVLLWFFSPH